MEQKAIDYFISQGILGVIVLALAIICGKVIVSLYKDRIADLKAENAALRKDFDEMRGIVREKAFEAAEEATTAVLRNNGYLEKSESMMQEIRILLSRFWESKL